MAGHVHRFCERTTFFGTNETNDSSEIENDGQTTWACSEKRLFFENKQKKRFKIVRTILKKLSFCSLTYQFFQQTVEKTFVFFY